MTAPKKIFLQWDEGICDLYLNEVTWCVDQINPDDVEYVRKDVTDKLLSACNAALINFEMLQEAEGLFQGSWNMNVAINKCKAAIADAEDDE